jgi:hypothetical protein
MQRLTSRQWSLSRRYRNARFPPTLALGLLLCTAAFSPFAVCAEVILDNGGTGTAESGTWSVSGGANPYGANSLYSSQNGDRYTFTLNLAPGEYQVYAWWTEYANRRTSVPYDVHHLGGTETVTVNQQNNGGQWNLLGTWSFGSSATITLRSPHPSGGYGKQPRCTRPQFLGCSAMYY